ncbi:hypothetical protein [Carnobacterium sp. TMP28]|uniref:hypothetical protein n=1 Tax=Carnobacterium sp. TMP28 TaxID=3397060 RepID=UPI0039DF6A50
MFEVNFFEKKQKNFLPYLLTGMFLFLLILLGLYFFSMQAHYTNTEKQNKEWLQAEQENLDTSKEMQKYVQLTQKAVENKVAFKAKQYPIAYVTKVILEQIPDAKQQVTIFNKNELNQVTLIVEGLTTKELANTVEKFKTVEFISDVHLIRMENKLDGAGSIVELWLEIDETTIVKENLL